MLFHKSASVALATLILIAVGTRGNAVPLQDLLNGGSLVVRDARFSDWELVGLDATGSSPNLSLVAVTALAADPENPGMQFAPNGQYAVAGLGALDVTVRFRVSARVGGKAFTGHSLAIGGLTFGGASGTTVVSQEVVDYAAADLGPALVMVDNAASVLLLSDARSIVATPNLTVTLNVFEQGFSASDSISIGSFSTRFAQAGPSVLAGDYNDDGVVNAADYVLWRDNLGSAAGSLANDVDGGPIGVAQYARWRANFGAAMSSAAFRELAGGSAAVPEPPTGMRLGLATAAMLAEAARRRWRGGPVAAL